MLEENKTVDYTVIVEPTKDGSAGNLGWGTIYNVVEEKGSGGGIIGCEDRIKIALYYLLKGLPDIIKVNRLELTVTLPLVGNCK
jgi:hypothetical protein